MSDTLDALKAKLEPETAQPSPEQLLEQMVKDHREQEEAEADQDVNPFDLIDKGSVKIGSIAEADAVARLLVEADRRLADVEAIEAKRVARERSRTTRLHAIFEGALGLWTRGQLKGKTKRSMLLQHAELSLRKRPAHEETSCEADVIAWAEREYIDAIAYPPKLSIEKVKEWEATNKKPAPGRIHVEESENFAVKMPKKEVSK